MAQCTAYDPRPGTTSTSLPIAAFSFMRGKIAIDVLGVIE